MEGGYATLREEGFGVGACRLALVVFHCCGSIRSPSWHGRSTFSTVLMMNSAEADSVKVHDGIAHRRRNTFHG